MPNVALALGLEPDAVSGSFEAQRLVGVALGRVVAHEVVHAVAPEVEHASAGVMRPKLHAFQLVTGRPALEADCAEALAAGARARLAGRGPARYLGAGHGRAVTVALVESRGSVRRRCAGQRP